MVMREAPQVDDSDALRPQDIDAFMSRHYNAHELHRLKRVKATEVGAAMTSKCRVVINVPVLYKEKGLYQSLSQYLNQDLDKDEKDKKEFVVAVYVNGPNGVDLANTGPYKAALKFMADHPRVKVVLRKCNYDPKETNISRIRRDGIGLTLMDAAKVEGLDLDNLIQINHDADLQAISSDYLSGHVKVFDENPQLAAIGGFCDYPEADFYQDHLFLAAQKFEDILTLMMASKYDSFALKGGASAVRTKDYISAGGLGRRRKMSELRPLYQKFKEEDPNSIILSRKVGTITTSARRQIMALGNDVPLSRSHDNFGEEGDLADRYQAPLDKLQIPEVANKVTSPSFKEKLEKQLSHFYDRELMYNRGGEEQVNQFFRRAGFFSGLKLEFKDKKVIIKDMEVMKKNILAKYSHSW